MESSRVIIHNLIILSFLIHGLYSFLIKRRDKNFYSESKLISMLSSGSGIILLLYDFTFLGMDEYNLDNDSKMAIILLGILLLIYIIFFLKSNLSGKKYNITNIDKGDFDTILSETLQKYGLAYKIDKNNSQSMVTKITIEEEYDASIEVTQRGGGGRSFALEFKGFSQVFDFDNIIQDMKERVNETIA